MSKNLSTFEIREILRKKYAAPEWALLEEVRNATGHSQEARSADALAMSLWPSRGLAVHGFEIKSSRGDWQRELKNPAKAEEISKYCDFWWIVTGGPNIVQKSELPPTWGLLVCHSGRLNIIQDAPKLAAQPLDRSFVAAMMRKMNDYVAQQVRSSEGLKDAFERGKACAVLDQPREMQQMQYDYEALKQTVADFEKESGFKVTERWSYGNLVGVLKRVQEFIYGPQPDAAIDQVKRTLSSSLQFIEAMALIQQMIAHGELTVPRPPSV